MTTILSSSFKSIDNPSRTTDYNEFAPIASVVSNKWHFRQITNLNSKVWNILKDSAYEIRPRTAGLDGSVVNTIAFLSV